MSARAQRSALSWLLALWVAACAASPSPTPRSAPQNSGALLAGLSQPSTATAQPSPVAAGLAQLLARVSLAELRALSPQERLDTIYDRLFGPGAGLAEDPGLDEATLRARLAAHGTGPQAGPWYIIDGRDGAFQNPTARLYLTVRAEGAEQASVLVPEGCRAAHIRYWYKVLQQLDQYARPTTSVLFVESPDVAKAERVLDSFVRTHPGAVRTAPLAFAQVLAPGIAFADEPNPPWPELGAPHSFGSFIAAVIVEAIDLTPADEPTALRRSVEARLRHYGVDPSRPWLHGTAPANSH